MRAGNRKAEAQKHAFETYRMLVDSIKSTAGRGVNLFVIALMDEAHEHLTQGEVYRAYERFCGMADEVLQLVEDDISAETIQKRLQQIVNDELFADGTQEKLLEAMNKLQEG